MILNIFLFIRVNFESRQWRIHACVSHFPCFVPFSLIRHINPRVHLSVSFSHTQGKRASDFLIMSSGSPISMRFSSDKNVKYVYMLAYMPIYIFVRVASSSRHLSSSRGVVGVCRLAESAKAEDLSTVTR